jgi:hypothetical protein
MEKEDKIIKVTTTDREMSLLLKDGTRLPTKGKVIDTYYESGRHDAKVVLEKPLSMTATKEK